MNYVIGQNDPGRSLRVLIENIRDYAVFEMNLSGFIETWNTGAENVTGYQAKEILGKSGSILFTREDLERGEHERELQTALAEGRAQDERWHVRRDGTLFWGSGVVTCLYDESRKPGGFVKVLRDVTAQKEANDRLRESEQRLRLLVENVKDSALVQLDLQGRIIYWNTGAEKIFGYRQDEVLGHDYALVFSPEDVERGLPKEDLNLTLETGRAEYEQRLIRKDGTSFEAAWVTELVLDEDGHKRGVVKVLRDRTESKQKEEELRESQKMEALGRLAGGVAHDFNNLLTVIGGYTTVIQQKTGDQPALSSALVQIQESVQRAARLTGQLLAFSRKQPVQPAVLSLNGLLTGMEKMLRTLIGEDIELILSLNPAAGSVHADPGQIEQIVLNLAANARDAMPGGGTLRIATNNHPAEPAEGVAAFVTVTVYDSGHGMDPATMAHIFEPFFTTKPTGKGTGLGLATSYSIARQSGGTLTVESQPGHGSTFTLSLPRVEGKPPVRPKQKKRQSEPAGSGTILVVEDDPSLRALFVQSLRSAGYSVLEAADGEAALRLSEEQPGGIDLLVTDVVMPKMGGVELSGKIRQQRSGTKVLFMSGYSEQLLTGRRIPGRNETLLQKPFELESLLQAVNRALSGKKNRRGVGAAD